MEWSPAFLVATSAAAVCGVLASWSKPEKKWRAGLGKSLSWQPNNNRTCFTMFHENSVVRKLESTCNLQRKYHLRYKFIISYDNYHLLLDLQFIWQIANSVDLCLFDIDDSVLICQIAAACASRHRGLRLPYRSFGAQASAPSRYFCCRETKISWVRHVGDGLSHVESWSGLFMAWVMIAKRNKPWRS